MDTPEMTELAERTRLLHQNRIDGKSANKHKFWCLHCDGALVGEYGKCPRCGLKQSKKKRFGFING